MTQNGEPHHYEPRMFPPGFLWGTATSAYQVEGGNVHADWVSFEEAAGHIADQTKAGRGVEHFERYKQDFEIAQGRLHNNAYRLSVEWSRLEPTIDTWDEAAFAHYREMLKDLKKRNMTVMLTLHHFTNPQWLSERGGWETHFAVVRFTRFVEKVCEELGAWVDLWVTINEPLVYAMQGYLVAEWPPAKRSYTKLVRVLWSMTRAHKKAYRLIHRAQKRRATAAQVGIAHNVSSFHVYQKHSFLDQITVAVLDRLTNHIFYTLSGIRTHDFLGLNYYFHFRLKSVLKFLRRSMLPSDTQEHKRVDFESSDIGWELFPHGIFDVCVDIGLHYKKPIYITENGLATDNDDKRLRALIGYLLQLHHAIQAGVDVRGYFHWSLLDNFEWAKGYAPKFGLVAVDRRTMERTVRPSGDIYGMIAKGNAIEHDFLRFLGHGTRDIVNAWKKDHGMT
ncbi:glycoside hydrolase family 1 protein [Candidatus Uhrbacteria bacterium]|nr:glycoside hydrolase family 1 protein [Candidatus Uhrbacteria bacterium]